MTESSTDAQPVAPVTTEPTATSIQNDAGSEPVPADAQATAPDEAGRSLRMVRLLARPFAWSFMGALGVVLALSLGSAASALSSIVITIGMAIFLALALDPAVRRLEGKGLRRGAGIAIVCGILALVVGGALAFVIPAVVGQVLAFAGAVPGYLANLKASDGFQAFTSTTGGAAFYESMLAQLQAWLSDPSHLLFLGAGALAAGIGAIEAVSGTLIVLVLTIYFLASLNAMKAGLYELVPAYGRAKVAELTEQITGSVGGFVGGGLTLSAINAVFTFGLLAVLGMPYALMLAMVALVVTLLPMVGSVVFWIIATFATLLSSPPAAIAFAVLYFLYMQVEAYLITPRVMGRSGAVPGALVLIGAMVGATLLGLLGALIAVPVTAAILMILRGVLIPRQNAKTSPPPGDMLHAVAESGAPAAAPDRPDR